MSGSVKGKNKASISEKFASYYGNVKSLLQGGDLTGRRQACQENPFSSDSETHLVGFKKDDSEELHLKPTNVDLHRSKNRGGHHTQEYEVPNLILRRGQQFDVTLDFQRDFVKENDVITLKFVTGNRPTQSRGSVVAVSEVGSLTEGSWGFTYSLIRGKSVTLRVCSASDTIIGRYELFIDTSHTSDRGTETWRHKHPDDIYVIFNPWNKDDAVFLPDETDRCEFVMSETGRLWLGSVDKHFVRPWNFGQFEYVCLIAAISLLDGSELSDRAKSNPTLVTRTINKALHYTEREGGVVQAGWSGKYDDAEPPHAWTGSPAILENFLKTRRGVKYGQCWTLAAVNTTLLRALGVPSRCVTCYRAVHDSDYSGPVNTHWSPELRPKTDVDDAIWSFHVWTEAWFKRNDLPNGYDGWQALDPTPAECSEGVVTSGPAPVAAILKGDLHLGYDTKFLFSELHGGRIHWQVDTLGNMEAFSDGRDVGVALSTKTAGSISRHDVTASYKHDAGSNGLKAVRDKVASVCNRKDPTLVRGRKNDVDFTLEGGVAKSGDLSVTLNIQNVGTEGRIVDVYMGVYSTFYTGVTALELKKLVTNVVTEARTDSAVNLSLKCGEYMSQKEADNNITSYVMAKVRETGQRFATVQSHCIDRPHLTIKTEGRAVQGQNFQVVVKISNTLSVPLTECVIAVDGPGLSRTAGIKVRKSQIEPGEEVRETVTLTARRPGPKEIVAVFYCRQICHVTAVADIDVVKDDKNV